MDTIEFTYNGILYKGYALHTWTLSERKTYEKGFRDAVRAVHATLHKGE